MLISIISSYQQCFDVKPPSKHFENLDILSTSTPKKRGISPCTGADDSLLCKRAKFRLEDSFSEPENAFILVAFWIVHRLMILICSTTLTSLPKEYHLLLRGPT